MLLIECQLLSPTFIFKSHLLGSLFFLERRSLSLEIEFQSCFFHFDLV
jgi:hypothetical protein